LFPQLKRSATTGTVFREETAFAGKKSLGLYGLNSGVGISTSKAGNLHCSGRISAGANRGNVPKNNITQNSCLAMVPEVLMGNLETEKFAVE
jgi:hypothetical protein